MERVLTEDQRACHQTFKTSAYEQHKNINPNRAHGTCEWILRSVGYQQWWKRSCNDLLWISADPGCGKSVLAKSLVDEIFKTSNTPAKSMSICYFFFKDNHEQNNLSVALCAILHQLFSQQPQLLKHALPSWEKNQNRLQQEIDELWRILMAAASDPELDISDSIICVFDALDECRSQDRKQLIEYLKKFYTQQPTPTQRSWLKFLITSRPYNDIEDSFRLLIKAFPQIHLRCEDENDRIHEEINIVVKIKVEDLGESLSLKPDTQMRLLNELLQMNHRTYLWLYLAIDDIRNTFENSFRPDEEAIQRIPRSVNEAYEKILGRVKSDQEPKVRKILQIIVGARRPLYVSKMAMALGVATSSCQTAAQAGINTEGLDKKIRQLCGLFIFINDSKIYLIHQTAREFLISTMADESINRRWYLKPNDTEVTMTQICVKYLLFEDLIVGGKDDRIRSFLEYSAKNWPKHFRDACLSLPEEQELFGAVDKLYDVSSQQFTLWFPTCWEGLHIYGDQPKLNAVHVAALVGHDEIIDRLFALDPSVINQKDSKGMNALQWASMKGNYEVLRQLLGMGADVNDTGGFFGTALQCAAHAGHEEIVQLLLDNGADVDALNRYNDTALHLAASNGYGEIMRRLLDKGAGVNTPSGSFGTALRCAAALGYGEIVQQLLDKGADVNTLNKLYNDTALHSAASEGYREIVRQLLDKGIDVNALNGANETALHLAAREGHGEIVQQLLDKCADTNALNEDNNTALHFAAREGHREIVQHLLGRGKNHSYANKEGSTPLLLGAYSGRLDVVQLLLENGADLSIANNNGWTPLHMASFLGHEEIVKMLLGHPGVELNAEDIDGRTPLFYASARDQGSVLQVLLRHKPAMNVKDRYDSTALFAAVRNGHESVTEQLLALDEPSIDSRDGLGKGLLWWARKSGNGKVIDLVHKYAQIRGGIEAFENEFDTAHNVVKFDNQSLAFCDVCCRGIQEDASIYVCKTCSAGAFFICIECQELGFHCRDASHELVFRHESSDSRSEKYEATSIDSWTMDSTLFEKSAVA